MMVLGLGLQWHFDKHLTGSINFEQSRLVSGLGEQDSAIIEGLDGVDFVLCSFEEKILLPVAIHLDGRTARVGFAFR